ncbi:MAG: fumarate hydratase C-terminal domain-containing protein [Gammaproteobacteria bacterium]|nr:fumarate hydratase C-terminal domain-containing protein [Gammaproteobacteria bacterium]
MQEIKIHLAGLYGYLVSKAIRKARIVAFEDLGMEAIHEFTVEEMPITVAVDVDGTSVHQTGPAIWKKKIAEEHAIEVVGCLPQA